MRGPVKRLIAGVAALAILVAASCGALEDTTAARVGDQEITVHAVERLAASEIIGQQAAGAGLVSPTQGTTGSARARAALSLLLYTGVLEDAVRARGGFTADDREQGRSEAESQMQGADEPELVKVLGRYFAARVALVRVLGAAEEPGQDQIEAYFEENRSQFEQSCVEGFAVLQPAATAAQAAVDGGASVDEVLADPALGAQSLDVEPGEVCVSDTGQLNPDLAALVFDGTIGEWDSVPLTGQTGDTFVVFVRPSRRVDATLDDPQVLQAVTDAVTQANQEDAQARLDDQLQAIMERAEVDVDPRYGDWDPSSAELLLPPRAPELSARERAALAPDPLAGLTPGA